MTDSQISKEWKMEYEPLKHLYKHKNKIDTILSVPIKITELNDTIKNCNLKLTPGPTKILYKFYKNSEPKIKKLICNLFNICIKNGTPQLNGLSLSLFYFQSQRTGRTI